MTAYGVLCNTIESFLEDDEVEEKVVVVGKEGDGAGGYREISQIAERVDNSIDNIDDKKQEPTSVLNVNNKVESLLDDVNSNSTSPRESSCFMSKIHNGGSIFIIARYF